MTTPATTAGCVTAARSQKAVTAHLKSEQLPSFYLARPPGLAICMIAPRRSRCSRQSDLRGETDTLDQDKDVDYGRRSARQAPPISPHPLPQSPNTSTLYYIYKYNVLSWRPFS